MDKITCPYCLTLTKDLKDIVKLLRAHHEVIRSCAEEVMKLNGSVKRLEARLFAHDALTKKGQKTH